MLVDPLIETVNKGDTFPGAVVPFGMVQFSSEGAPDSKKSKPIAASGGYEHHLDLIRGFSLTNVSGWGCAGESGGQSSKASGGRALRYRRRQRLPAQDEAFAFLSIASKALHGVGLMCMPTMRSTERPSARTVCNSSITDSGKRIDPPGPSG